MLKVDAQTTLRVEVDCRGGPTGGGPTGSVREL